VEIARWGGQAVPVWSVAFAPDGRILAAGASENIVTLWDVSSAGVPNTLSGHSDQVTSLAFSADAKTLASGSKDNTIKLWDAASGQELRTLSVHHKVAINSYGVLDMVFSPDGSMLASVSETVSSSTSNFFFNVDVWDVTSGKLIHTWGEDYIWGVAFSPDGKYLAWGKGTQNMIDKIGNNVILSDVASGREVRTLSGHTARITSVAFSPDSKTLASGSDDGTIRMWDVTNGQKLSSVSGYSGAVTSVAFSPDGKFITIDSGDSTIRLWGVYP
jgi:WD40 repeat protein